MAQWNMPAEQLHIACPQIKELFEKMKGVSAQPKIFPKLPAVRALLSLFGRNTTNTDINANRNLFTREIDSILQNWDSRDGIMAWLKNQGYEDAYKQLLQHERKSVDKHVMELHTRFVGIGFLGFEAPRQIDSIYDYLETVSELSKSEITTQILCYNAQMRGTTADILRGGSVVCKTIIHVYKCTGNGVYEEYRYYPDEISNTHLYLAYVGDNQFSKLVSDLDTAHKDAIIKKLRERVRVLEEEQEVLQNTVNMNEGTIRDRDEEISILKNRLLDLTERNRRFEAGINELRNRMQNVEEENQAIRRHIDRQHRQQQQRQEGNWNNNF